MDDDTTTYEEKQKLLQKEITIDLLKRYYARHNLF